MSVTSIMNRLAKLIPDGEDKAMSYSDGRAYLFDRAGNVVSTLTREGENAETLHFRLMAALVAVGVTENG